MKNFVQPGGTIDVVAGGTVVAGAGDLVGDLFGVYLSGASTGQTVAFQTEGVVSLVKASGTVNPGVRVFWDNTAKRVTTTPTGNRCIGWHVGLAANSGGDGTSILVKLGAPNAAGA